MDPTRKPELRESFRVQCGCIPEPRKKKNCPTAAVDLEHCRTKERENRLLMTGFQAEIWRVKTGGERLKDMTRIADTVVEKFARMAGEQGFDKAEVPLTLEHKGICASVWVKALERHRFLLDPEAEVWTLVVGDQFQYLRQRQGSIATGSPVRQSSETKRSALDPATGHKHCGEVLKRRTEERA